MPGARPYTLNYTQVHPLARMLPLFRPQMQVYRHGERIPPSALEGHGPVWETTRWTLDAFATQQSRVNLQRDFTLISVSAKCSSNLQGGFRLQMYDLKKRYRFQDRGIDFGNLAGPVQIDGAPKGGAAFFLREPYRFEVPDSQIYIECQNLESVPNTISFAVYGQVLRFNEAGPEFPGGNVTGWDWANSVQKIQHQRGEGRR